MERIDLHTHSTASDGSMTPAQLAVHAKEMGLKAFALTDHDTVSGLKEAQAAAHENGIELVKGVELSSRHEKTELHIIGLDIDDDSPSLKEAMRKMQEKRETRNLCIIHLMADAGVDITYEKLIAMEGTGVLTRANFADYLVRTGFVKNRDAAFNRYLGDYKSFYVPKDLIPATDAIRLILENGGIPVLAHPLNYRLGKDTLTSYISCLKENGLEAIEVYYGTHTQGDILYLGELARRFGLKFSGGSDYHGTFKPHLEIGRGKGRMVIPYDILENLRKR